MSIEIDYLRKKAGHFRYRQIVGLVLIIFGVVVMVLTHFLVPVLARFSFTLWEKLEVYVTWGMAAGVFTAFWGVVLTIHYSRKLFEFIVDWSRMMMELEKRIREIED